MIFAAVFAIIVGLGMIGQWAMSYFSKQIPELKTEPVRIGFHLAAEMSTAICLICSGLGKYAFSTCQRNAILHFCCQPGLFCPERAVGLAGHVFGHLDRRFDQRFSGDWPIINQSFVRDI